MDCSLSGSSIHGIFQARIQSGLPFSSPGDVPDPGIELRSPTLQADSLPDKPQGKPNLPGPTNIYTPMFTGTLFAIAKRVEIALMPMNK